MACDIQCFKTKSQLTLFGVGRALITAVLVMGSALIHADTSPVATTAYGKVRGVQESGINVFKGIRYGADTATTRFQAPKKPAAWSGIKDALDYPSQAPQASGGMGGGLFASWANRKDNDEDCLFLNVWTPGLNDGKKRPVMVWLHGGGFSAGSGASHGYDGTRLANRGDVVVVTINHRLNVFGHLYLGQFDEQFADSGNAGILDIELALEWVRDNIEQFGGDPDNVMIFGESGGGAKVTTLMTMPSAKGLFHKGAVQSGAWLLFIEPQTASDLGKAVITELGLTPDSVSNITTFSTQEIQQAVGAAMRKGARPNWGPVIDNRNLYRHPFTPDAPEVSKDVPMLIGFNRAESSIFLGPRFPQSFTLSWEELPELLAKNVRETDPADIIAKYRQRHPDYNPTDVFFAATTDSQFVRAHTAQVERKAEQGGAPAYFYMLNWNTPVDGGKWRSPHALEIGLVFDNVAKSTSMSGTGAEPQRIADLMSEAWIAFAKTGNPNHELLPEWPAYNTDTRPAMVFDLEPKVVNDVRGVERRWFDHLIMGPNG
ncbi:carboxylesterase/lipase family protein [Aurantivibrio plasticivorans]